MAVRIIICNEAKLMNERRVAHDKYKSEMIIEVNRTLSEQVERGCPI